MGIQRKVKEIFIGEISDRGCSQLLLTLGSDEAYKAGILNRCFAEWTSSTLPENKVYLSLALDGKMIRSIGKMERYENPLHIVGVQVEELGATYGQQTVAGKRGLGRNECIESLYTEFETKGVKSSELTSEELLCHARMEWFGLRTKTYSGT